MITKVIIALSISLSTLAYTLIANVPIAFKSGNISVNVAANGCTNVTDSPAEIMEIAEDAVHRFWNTIATSDLHLRGGSFPTVSANYLTDQICSTAEAGCTTPVPSTNTQILLVCNNNSSIFTSTGILAVTLPNNLSGTTINGAVIGINDIAGTQYNTQTRDEKISVIAHEIGHAIGLGHSKKENALMFGTNLSGRFKLGQDDWVGASYLYPKQQLPLCGTIQDISKNGPTNSQNSFIIGLSLILLIFMGSNIGIYRRKYKLF